MPRPVYPFLPTWEDRRFKKELSKLSPDAREGVLEEIRALIDALAGCRDPIRDRKLRPYQPSPYRAPGLKNEPRLYEYRLSGVTRVLAAWVQDGEAVLMVAVTLSHDHPRLIRLLKQHRSSLMDWKRPDD